MSNEEYNEHSLDAVIARIDVNLSSIRAAQDELHEKHDKVLERVSKLERWRWYLVGVFAAGGIGGGVTADVLGKILKSLSVLLVVMVFAGCTFRTVTYQTAAGPVVYKHKSFGVRQSIGELRVREGDVEVSIKGYSNDQAEVIGVAVERAVGAAIKGAKP